MANEAKKDREELDRLLFDSLGEHVPPKSWTIQMSQGSSKVPRRFLVFTRSAPPDRKAAYDDINRALKGTRFEGKVDVFFPA